MTESRWNRDPPPGFQGLRDDLPITFYFRHLPHWRQDGATYFVTFRLADSLPKAKLRQLDALKREFARQHGILKSDWRSVLRKSGNGIPRESWEAFCKEQMRRVERWLDQGMGECHLRKPATVKIIADALQHFDNASYELGSYVVMPNHVHAIVRPFSPKTQPLEKILQGRKLWTSRQIKATIGRGGQLWQDETFDRIIRDEEHLYSCIQYIGNNPQRAGLSPEQAIRWISPVWERYGWRFDS